MYTRISSTVIAMASMPLTTSSLPTCGPTTSVRRICAPGSTVLSAASIFCVTALADSFSPSGGKRTSTSFDEPKFCTAMSV